jgi:hypothetical protein
LDLKLMKQLYHFTAKPGYWGIVKQYESIGLEAGLARLWVSTSLDVGGQARL